jgi:hypothetical protein
MTTGHRLLSLTNQRGVALPLALLTLLILSVLIIAFSVLSATEPGIANNHLSVAQARAIAEAGLERAIWALNNPTNANGLADPLPGTVPAPYNGSSLVMLQANGVTHGGFRVTVANGAAANERVVTSTGWVPNDTAPRKTHQIVTATVNKFQIPDPPAGLTVKGEVQVSGNATVDARSSYGDSDPGCANKKGIISNEATLIGGNGKIYGGTDGNNQANQIADYTQNVNNPNFFTPYLLYPPISGASGPPYYDETTMNALKAYAQSKGTYYRGSVTFNSSNPLPNGIVFVDTVSGQNIDLNGPNTTPSSDFAQVQIHGNAGTGPGGAFQGWLIVNGTLAISGNFLGQGYFYAVNDFSYQGTGTGQIRGAVLSQNIRDISATSIDTPLGGNSLIQYDCRIARNGNGAVPRVWMIKGGTYKEVPG